MPILMEKGHVDISVEPLHINRRKKCRLNIFSVYTQERGFKSRKHATTLFARNAHCRGKEDGADQKRCWRDLHSQLIIALKLKRHSGDGNFDKTLFSLPPFFTLGRRPLIKIWCIYKESCCRTARSVHKANCLSLVGPIECAPADANTAAMKIYTKHTKWCERRTINRSGGGGAPIAIGADRFQSKHSVENIVTAEPSAVACAGCGPDSCMPRAKFAHSHHLRPQLRNLTRTNSGGNCEIMLLSMPHHSTPLCCRRGPRK